MRVLAPRPEQPRVPDGQYIVKVADGKIGGNAVVFPTNLPEHVRVVVTKGEQFLVDHEPITLGHCDGVWPGYQRGNEVVYRAHGNNYAATLPVGVRGTVAVMAWVQNGKVVLV